jgi:hypothetical protein
MRQPEFSELADGLPFQEHLFHLRKTPLLSLRFPCIQVPTYELPYRPFFITGTRPRHPELVPWGIDQDIPALVSPLFEPHGKSGKGGMGISIVIVELNRKVLLEEIFPELAKRYFSGADGYRLAILRGEHRQPIYTSDAGFDSTLLAKTDATMNLFGPPMSADGLGWNFSRR